MGRDNRKRDATTVTNTKKGSMKTESLPKKSKAKQPSKKKLKHETYEDRVAAEKEILARHEKMEENIRKWESLDMKHNIASILSHGFVFCPSEGQLLDYYLRRKCSGIGTLYSPMAEEINVYAHRPQELADIYLSYFKSPHVDLAGKSEVSYFFTRSCPNETQLGEDVQGNWTPAEKQDICNADVKVGCKQVFEYYEGVHKSEYKISLYQLDPAPDNPKNGLWFICKLYKHGTCVDSERA